jgi:hypothetical protein
LRQIEFFLCLIFLISACSVSRIHERKNSPSTQSTGKEKGIEGIENQNLTKYSFFIQKAEFRLVINGETKNGVGSIKFEKPDKYLISIKSRGGIEITRIFISDDTVMINDRINRKFYYGTPAYLKSKYRIDTSVLPLLLGDYINDKVYDTNKINCLGGKFNIEGVINRLKVNYIVDCAIWKIIYASPEDNVSEGKFQIRYDDFIKNGEISTPQIIEISDGQSKSLIEIKIDKIESPWEGKIQFIPGSNYEKIHLL